MSNPYLIEGPALISFSGGRTSAYMLFKILEAHGGTLPSGVMVLFANTGKERSETLDFVAECALRWDVPVHWIEWQSEQPRWREVGWIDAARNGEPFLDLISSKQYLPNGFARFCTTDLKLMAIRNFLQAYGFTNWKNVIGLRHDEGARCLKAYARNKNGSDPWTTVIPMDKARATVRDVTDFWATQPFDLGLKHYEGNCDLCFLKRREKLRVIIRENPGIEDWWIDAEARIGRTFNDGYSYADLAREVREQPHFFDEPVYDGDYDAECGLACGADDLEAA